MFICRPIHFKIFTSLSLDKKKLYIYIYIENELRITEGMCLSNINVFIELYNQT